MRGLSWKLRDVCCTIINWLTQWLWIWRRSRPPTRPCRPWLRAVSSKAKFVHGRRKPTWVRQAVLALTQELPHAGYRTLAHCFNLRHAHLLDARGQAVSVSKSFVAQVLQQHRLDQLHMQSGWRTARVEPIQTTWGMDLTGLPLVSGNHVPVFGVIDHGSRALLALTPVAQHNSLVLLGKLLIAIGTYGKPRAVRSDNDAVFKTLLFRAVLMALGINQQFTALGSPWQNGRIERFWRTLKNELQTRVTRSISQGQMIQTQMKFSSVYAMRDLLDKFKTSYNHCRPHQSLQGHTPAMVWNAKVHALRGKLKGKRAKDSLQTTELS